MKNLYYSSYQKEKIKQINNEYRHPIFSLELRLLNEIKTASISSAKITLNLINQFERAKLANSNLRSLKNSLIISAALFVRAAISAKVSPENAFVLSDYFIAEIENIDNINILKNFEYEMLEKTIELIKNNSHPQYSRQIEIIVNYIENNISAELSVSKLAKIIKRNPDYLSTIFKNEVGRNLKDYINYKKIDLAKNYLEFSDIKIIDLSVLLGFCSQAHFSFTFKKYTSLSPKEYRKNHLPSFIQE